MCFFLYLYFCVARQSASICVFLVIAFLCSRPVCKYLYFCVKGHLESLQVFAFFCNRIFVFVFLFCVFVFLFCVFVFLFVRSSGKFARRGARPRLGGGEHLH